VVKPLPSLLSFTTHWYQVPLPSFSMPSLDSARLCWSRLALACGYRHQQHRRGVVHTQASDGALKAGTKWYACQALWLHAW
jgi:hypothetical protein